MPTASTRRSNTPFVQSLCNHHHTNGSVCKDATDHREDIGGMPIRFGLLRLTAHITSLRDVRGIAELNRPGFAGGHFI